MYSKRSGSSSASSSRVRNIDEPIRCRPNMVGMTPGRTALRSVELPDLARRIDLTFLATLVVTASSLVVTIAVDPAVDLGEGEVLAPLEPLVAEGPGREPHHERDRGGWRSRR